MSPIEVAEEDAAEHAEERENMFGQDEDVTEEGPKLKVRASGAMPSKKEVLEHARLHMPYRS